VPGAAMHVGIRVTALGADRLAIQQQSWILGNEPHAPHQVTRLEQGGIEATGSNAAQASGQLSAGRRKQC